MYCRFLLCLFLMIGCSEAIGPIDEIKSLMQPWMESIHFCEPLLTLIKNLFKNIGIELFGYDQYTVKMYYNEAIMKMKKIHHLALSGNALICVESNFEVLEFVTKGFINDSTCLNKQVRQLKAILTKIWKSLFPDHLPRADVTCLIPAFCSSPSMMVNGKRLLEVGFTLSREALGLVHWVLNFSDHLQTCQRQIVDYTDMASRIISNADLCRSIA